jgi:hypothetical protein
LRNYIQLFFGEVDWTNIFNNPASIILVERSVDQLNTLLAQQVADVEASGGTNISSYVLGTRYVQLDKDNLFVLITRAGPEQLWLFPDDPKGLQSQVSPRNTGWTDNQGVKRSPPPSERGRLSKVPRPLRLPPSKDPIAQSIELSIGNLTGLSLGASGQLRSKYLAVIACLKRVLAAYLSKQIPPQLATNEANQCLAILMR